MADSTHIRTLKRSGSGSGPSPWFEATFRQPLPSHFHLQPYHILYSVECSYSFPRVLQASVKRVKVAMPENMLVGKLLDDDELLTKLAMGLLLECSDVEVAHLAMILERSQVPVPLLSVFSCTNMGPLVQKALWSACVRFCYVCVCDCHVYGWCFNAGRVTAFAVCCSGVLLMTR